MTYREFIEKRKAEIEARLTNELAETAACLLASDSSSDPLFKGYSRTNRGADLICKEGLGYRLTWVLDHEPDMSNGDVEMVTLSREPGVIADAH